MEEEKRKWHPGLEKERYIRDLVKGLSQLSGEKLKRELERIEKLQKEVKDEGKR